MSRTHVIIVTRHNRDRHVPDVLYRYISRQPKPLVLGVVVRVLLKSVFDTVL